MSASVTNTSTIRIKLDKKQTKLEEDKIRHKTKINTESVVNKLALKQTRANKNKMVSYGR